MRAATVAARDALAAVGEGDRLLAHSLDLAAATGRPLEPPTEVVESAVRTAAAAAVRTGDGVASFRQLLGRPGGECRPLFG